MLTTFILATIFLMTIYEMMKVEKRIKYMPAKIKKCKQTGNLFVKLIERDVRVAHQDQEEVKTVIESRTDFNGSAPKRYTSTCYFKTKNIPAWYSESVLIKIGSTKRIYDEKVWFKHKIQPYYWAENMTTEINFPPTIQHTSQLRIPVATPDDDHYISLEPQQTAAGAS